MLPERGATEEAVLVVRSLWRVSWRIPCILMIAMLAAAIIWAGSYVLSGDAKVSGKPGPIRITAIPLNLDSADPHRGTLGRLEFRQAWALESNDPVFGGISAMSRLPDGTFLALNDTGVVFRLPLPPSTAGQFVVPLPIRPEDRKYPGTHWDSESLTTNARHSRYWVGFELFQSICRYAVNFSRLEGCRTWPQMQRWPTTGSVEAMTRLKDGRFLVISEMGPGRREGNDMLLFAGDPVDPDTPEPRQMNYLPPVGYRPTDAVQLDATHILVLNRRVTMLSGFTAVVTMIDLSQTWDNAVLAGEELARFEPPVLADNLEAMTVERRDGETLLWLASDDNHMVFQRTLLLSFRIPDNLVQSIKAGR